MGLLLSWQVKNKQVLLIGGGSVAKSRFDSLILAGATDITIIASNVEQELLQVIEQTDKDLVRINVHNRPIEESDFYLSGGDSGDSLFDLVLSAINDRAASSMISQRCHELRIPVNCADIPPQCDFYFGSMINRGPLQVMISTNGQSPRLAVKIRQELEKTVDELDPEAAIANMGKLRQAIRDKTQNSMDSGVIKMRMQWISSLTDQLSFRQMAQLDDRTIADLVSQYPAEPILR